MLDIKKIRKNPKEIEKKLQKKDPKINLTKILEIDEKIRKLQTEVEELKAQKNKISKEIGEKKSKKENVSNLMKEVSSFSKKIENIDKELKTKEEEREKELSHLPNIPMDDVKVSLNPKDNVCIKTFKEKKEFSFPFKNHLELNEKLNLFDFQTSAKLSGTGWPLYKGLGARLEWALLNYMLDTHIKNGFIPIMPPLLAKKEITYASGQLPKFEDQLFKLNDKDYKLYLIPTAEVILNGMHFDTILKKDNLPLHYVSYTPCFRREAGSAGKNERGLIRTHQFNKVELFSVTKKDESEKAFQKILSSAEEVLQGLNLHYRNMLLVTGDTSFASAKTIDIEVFLPGQNRYYEVSSVSNCTDYQSRRSKTRYKEEKMEYPHTLNGSGVATSRLMAALLENNQQEDGSVIIPKVLHKYLEEEITILK
jgi:seryl-tRNA synthetase